MPISVKPPKPMPEGIHEFRVDGFKPAKSKNSDSINLNPQLKIINPTNPELIGKELYFNMNTNFFTGIIDFCHSVGVPLVADGDEFNIPGEFANSDQTDPKKWGPYTGDLLGKTGRVELGMADNGKGGQTVKVKRFFCVVPGCQEKHSDSLNN